MSKRKGPLPPPESTFQEMDQKLKNKTCQILTRNSFDPKTYEYDPSFKPWDPNGDPLGVHTTAELFECLQRKPIDDFRVELDAKVLHLRKSAQGGVICKPMRIGKEAFLNAFENDAAKKIRARENWGGGGWGGGEAQWGGTGIGQEYTPLVGGPFYKNLYFYQDYIRMHAEAFYAYHNDPFARATTQITRDFVVGTGYEIQTDMTSTIGKLAMAAWKAFEEVNELQTQIDQFADESSIYGECMFWELPNNQAKITYRLGPGDTDPVGIIPRVRLIDPSNIVEIVTYPEDITRPLFYVWLQPTQYQIFTSAASKDPAGTTPTQPTLKFIYRQIPANEMLHFKINCVSNEKRGRSDYFPVFNYLRRLRDSVNYALISLEKVSAWAIDTTVEGDAVDIANYIAAQRQLGTIPPPGSEFVHSAGIKRTYQGNEHASAHSSDAFQWALSCIAAGVGIPTSYYGTHLSGGTTRASALVATEPVAKKMEKRREIVKRVLRKLWVLCMSRAGLPSIDCNVIFPELISQDASVKLQNLLLSEQARWIKPERAAAMAAKELGVQNYSYQEEIKEIGPQLQAIPMPLTDPGTLNPPTSMTPGQSPTPGGGGGGDRPPAEPAGLTGAEKSGIKNNLSTL